MSAHYGYNTSLCLQHYCSLKSHWRQHTHKLIWVSYNYTYVDGGLRNLDAQANIMEVARSFLVLGFLLFANNTLPANKYGSLFLVCLFKTRSEKLSVREREIARKGSEQTNVSKFMTQYILYNLLCYVKLAQSN